MMQTNLVLSLCFASVVCSSSGYADDAPPAGKAAPAAPLVPLAPAVLGRVYHAQLSMTVAGVAPFTYMLAGDVRPPCLKLDSLTGMLHGLPTRSCLGNYHLHVVATDYVGKETPADFVLHVSDGEPASMPAPVAAAVIPAPPLPASEQPAVSNANGVPPATSSTPVSPAAPKVAVNPVQVYRAPRILATPHDGDTKLALIGTPTPAADPKKAPAQSQGAGAGGGADAGMGNPPADDSSQPHLLGLLSVDTLTTPCDPNHGNPLLLAPASGAAAGAAQYTATTDKAGMVTLQLNAPLYAGEIVCPYEEGSPEKPASVAEVDVQAQPAISVIDPMDWGRVRAFFVGGILIANDDSAAGAGSSSFSTAHEFLSFNLDKEWLAAAQYIRPVNGKGSSAGRREPSYLRRHNPAINTYFDARLTSIPVASTPQLTTPAAAGTTTTTGNQTEITSQQTARIAVGAYAPFLLTRWDWDRVPNALILAPIAKVGFDTLTGPTQQNVISNNAASTLTYERVYNFYNFGGRIGHMGLTRQIDYAPEMLSYLDITMGRYSNLPSFICHTTGSPSQVLPTTSPSGCTGTYPLLFPKGTAVYDSSKRLYRLDIEGLLKIPHLPFVLGINANIGQHTLGAGHIDPAFQAPDDLRFLFGTRFDVGQALSRLGLTPSTGTKTKTAGE